MDVVLKLDELTKRPQAIACHAWNKDGTLLAFCPMNHEIHIVKYVDGAVTPVEVLRSHDQKVTSIDWAPESNRIVSCAEDRNAYVWNLESDGWKPTLVMLQFQRAAVHVKWSHSEKKFAVASGAKCIAVCYYEEENNWWISKLIDGFESTVLSLAWHPSDCLMAACSSDRSVQLFAAAVKGVDNKPPRLFGGDVSLGKLGTKICGITSDGWVTDIEFSPDGKMLCFVSHDSCIHFVNMAEVGKSDLVVPSKDNVRTIRMNGLPHRRILFLSDNYLVAAGHDCNPILYQRRDQVWCEHSKLDDFKSRKQSAPQASARNAAFRKFEMASPQSPDADSNLGDSLPTRHQVRALDCDCRQMGRTKASILSTILSHTL